MELDSALDHGAALWILGDLRCATPAGEADVGALRGRQPQTVLARLAAALGAPVACTELGATLWRGRWPVTWRTTLRSVVSRLRGGLLSAGWPAGDPIRSVLDAYVLTADGPMWLDAAFARRAVSTAETALAELRYDRAATAGEAAWQLAQRPPVLSTETWFGSRLARWMTDTAHRAALVTASAWLAAGDPVFATHFARGAVEVAPYREKGWRLLLEMHGRCGDAAAVAATFDEMTALFEADLGVSPHPATFAVYRRLTTSAARPGLGDLGGPQRVGGRA
jgi:DNA-binding SARP family transcriptional activator